MSESSIRSHMIGIGEVLVIKGEEDIVWTVLGSCISVIFYTKGLSIICHAQLPSRVENGLLCSDSCPHPCFKNMPDSMEFRYVNCAVEYMIDLMKENSIPVNKISTALIGGASVIINSHGKKTIGDQNVEKAKEVLEKNRIVINRELVGGKEGLTLWFSSASNTILYNRHKTKEKIELQ